MSKTNEFFSSYLPSKIEKNPDLAKDINAIFVFDIKGAGTWSLDLKEGAGVTEGAADGSDCTLTTDEATWEQILDNPGKAVSMVMMGKLKISNLAHATKLQKVLA